MEYMVALIVALTLYALLLVLCTLLFFVFLGMRLGMSMFVAILVMFPMSWRTLSPIMELWDILDVLLSALTSRPGFRMGGYPFRGWRISYGTSLTLKLDPNYRMGLWRGIPFLRALPATGSHVARQHDLSIDVTWATFNALSLADGGEAVQPDGGLHHSVGRVKSLCTSLLQAGIHICGLQEARTPQGVARIGPFWRCSSGSDGGGNFGNELWVHLEWPFACGPHCAVRFQTEDFLVMHAEATILLIRVSNGVVDWRIAVLHAPHRGHELSHRKQWWGRARDLCQAHGAGHAWFVLADSNARVGACTSEFIGSYHADPECESGVLFHDFLRDLEVMIPSTFEGIMQGSSATLSRKGTAD